MKKDTTAPADLAPFSAERARMGLFFSVDPKTQLHPFINTPTLYLHTIVTGDILHPTIYDLAIQRRPSDMISAKNAVFLEQNLTKKLGPASRVKIALQEDLSYARSLTQEDRFIASWKEVYNLADKIAHPPMIVDHRRPHDFNRGYHDDIQQALEKRMSIARVATFLAELGLNPFDHENTTQEAMLPLLQPVGIPSERTISAIAPSSIYFKDQDARLCGIIRCGGQQVNLVETLKQELRAAGMQQYILVVNVEGKDIMIKPSGSKTRLTLDMYLGTIFDFAKRDNTKQVSIITTDHNRRHPSNQHGDMVFMDGKVKGLAEEIIFQGPYSIATFCVIPAAMVTEILEQN